MRPNTLSFLVLSSGLGTRLEIGFLIRCEYIQVLKNLTAPFRIPVRPVQDPRSVPYSSATQHAFISYNL